MLDPIDEKPEIDEEIMAGTGDQGDENETEGLHVKQCSVKLMSVLHHESPGSS